MISVVVFKWKPRAGYRSNYGGQQVNVLRRMVRRHYPEPHRFICVTDDPTGIDAGIEIVPLWDDHAEVPNPSFKDGPSCYRRLKVFSRDIGIVLGERFICIDLDVVITGDLRPIFNRKESFVGWRNPVPAWPLNGSLFMLDAGARPQVWETFDPETSPALSSRAGMRGSDQGWMSYTLGWDEAMVDHHDGVISYQKECKRLAGRLPRGARIVVFWGALDPWSPLAQKRSPWIKEHYR